MRIIITRGKRGYYVAVGNRFSGQLSPDEMLGLVAAIASPDLQRTKQWLRTKQQRDELRRENNQRRAKREAEAAGIPF